MNELKTFSAAAIKAGDIFLKKMRTEDQEAVATAVVKLGYKLSMALEFDQAGNSEIVLDLVDERGVRERLGAVPGSAPVCH